MYTMYNILSMVMAAAMLLPSMAASHMIMATPHPFDPGALDNSPLKADGSNFPCKVGGGSVYSYDKKPSQPNNFTIGTPQTLSFTGSATHGGGSCQISLTTDKAPTKSTQWEVIHSIEGGCPANVAGNIGDNPAGSGASTFQFSIPDGISPGDYTLAWTWFNKVGNREMYMNCAPITVLGKAAKRYEPRPAPAPVSKRGTSFPAMFVANIQGVSSGCGTTEGSDVKFPDPGSSVQTVAGSTFGPPTGCTGASASTGSNSSSGSSSNSGSSAAASSPTVAPGVFASSAAPASAATGTAAVPAAAAPSAASSPAAAAPSAASPVASAAPSAASAGGSSSTSTAGSLTGTCSNEGAWNCIGGTSFQRCASGAWSAVMPMAQGTTCTAGQSAELNMTAGKRAVAFGVPHVRRGMNTWGN